MINFLTKHRQFLKIFIGTSTVIGGVVLFIGLSIVVHLALKAIGY